MARQLVASNALLGSPDQLRRQAFADGYLYLSQLLDPAVVARLRDETLAILQDEGWLAAGAELPVEPSPAFLNVYRQIVGLELFNALAHDGCLVKRMRALFGEKPLVHARAAARLAFPENHRYSAPPHQDFANVQGTPETWTVWTPLGDFPRELGALSVLVGSHRDGLLPVQGDCEQGRAGIDTTELGLEWAEADFQVGDVVLFHSLTVHRTLPNSTADQVGIAAEYRYQPLSQPVARASFEPHYEAATWDEIYAGWQDESLKYYWKRLPLKLVEWAPDYVTAALMKV